VRGNQKAFVSLNYLLCKAIKELLVCFCLVCFMVSDFRGQIKGTVFFVAVLAFAVFFILYARQDNLSVPSESFFAYAPASGGEAVLASQVQVYFCPQDDCADNLIKRIDSADSNIFIAVYSFTHDKVADALVRAKEKGVEVKVVFDSVQGSNSSSDDEFLASKGIEVFSRDGSGSMHNKYAIIDMGLVATGSFNYSMNADTKNEENLLFVQSADLALQYKSNFDYILSVSDEVLGE